MLLFSVHHATVAFVPEVRGGKPSFIFAIATGEGKVEVGEVQRMVQGSSGTYMTGRCAVKTKEEEKERGVRKVRARVCVCLCVCVCVIHCRGRLLVIQPGFSLRSELTISHSVCVCVCVCVLPIFFLF